MEFQLRLGEGDAEVADRKVAVVVVEVVVAEAEALGKVCILYFSIFLPFQNTIMNTQNESISSHRWSNCRSWSRWFINGFFFSLTK